MGDRTSLDLIGRQEELVKAMVALGKPVIVFLFNGRPLSINYVAQNVPVIYECWYLGQETGRAVADVLFGDYNPGGKLPISVPRSVGHLPVFYNYKPSARRGYLFDDVSPLYAFGFGLSYTSFAIENPRLTKKRIRLDGSTQVLVDVANTGKRAGGEVVQLYIRDLVSSATRPVKELKGFRKIWLEPGESATVTLDITPAVTFLLRREHEVCRRTRRFRDHGRQLFAGCGSSEADSAGDQVELLAKECLAPSSPPSVWRGRETGQLRWATPLGASPPRISSESE